ncbi:MAG: protein disulfide oxidoreductase [endosymbiont of Galathealinum brachiosum]|uniref:Protein disulfide oxidoreductase n=1 Tax=endosymbiont of Galathealinum brachiosum TaxID=2200906 RepID=A0A370DBR7_9GAMM|nr:MAG: protein disulfide oxidoreductase [endosymbiont of Galathealinum brachiosum]
MIFLANAKQIYKKNKFIRLIFQVLIFLLIYLSIRAWQSVDNIQGSAPVIIATTLEGEKFDLREYQSKPVLVHFWATWCPVCQFENSNIANLVGDYQVITIASWSETDVQVRAYLADKGLSMPVIVDEDGEWAKVYGVKAVPSSFIIDPQGVIQFIEKGYTSEIGLRLRLWWLE